MFLYVFPSERVQKISIRKNILNYSVHTSSSLFNSQFSSTYSYFRGEWKFLMLHIPTNNDMPCEMIQLLCF